MCQQYLQTNLKTKQTSPMASNPSLILKGTLFQTKRAPRLRYSPAARCPSGCVSGVNLHSHLRPLRVKQTPSARPLLRRDPLLTAYPKEVFIPLISKQSLQAKWVNESTNDTKRGHFDLLKASFCVKEHVLKLAQWMHRNRGPRMFFLQMLHLNKLVVFRLPNSHRTFGIDLVN